MLVESTGIASLRVYQFVFTFSALDTISFGPQPGAQLRGALYNALLRLFCSETGSTHTPGHTSRCPACWLLANENPDNTRGRDLPRPLILQPPIGIQRVNPGQAFTVGLGLVGDRALSAFRFIFRALENAGRDGVGWQRGRFFIQAVDAVHPFSGQQVPLLNNRHLTLPPELPITHADILAQATRLPPNRVSLRLLTPLRIGQRRHLARRPDLGILLRRLVERCQAMVTHYGDGTETDLVAWSELYRTLGAVGDSAQLVCDETRWLDLHSGSRRSRTTSPIGGLVGRAMWEGDIAPALPWLLWGQVLHVGKSTVKGNGWYMIDTDPG